MGLSPVINFAGLCSYCGIPHCWDSICIAGVAVARASDSRLTDPRSCGMQLLIVFGSVDLYNQHPVRAEAPNYDSVN